MHSKYKIARGRTTGAWVGLAMASALAPSSAVAQTAPRTLVPDATVQGALAESDPKVGDRHYDSYRVRLREGEAIQADMKSSELDSYLDVIGPGSEEALKSHDDVGGGSRDARLRFVAPAAGDYLLRAQGFAGATGPYTLSVQRRTIPPPPSVVAIGGDGNASGRFGDQSPADDDDHPYALYSIEGRKGERVRIDMVSAGLDPQMELTLVDGDGDESFSTANDDGGEGLNSRIFAILPHDGRYRLKARSLNSEAGSYSVRVQRYAPVAGPPPGPAPLNRDAPTLDRLSFDDAAMQMEMDASGNATFFYRLYALPMNAGETLTIDLKAESFDPVLDAGVMSPLGFAVARTNDDADGANARLVLTPNASGTIYVRARSLNAESMGEYTLIVTEGAVPTPPPAEEEEGHEH